MRRGGARPARRRRAAPVRRRGGRRAAASSRSTSTPSAWTPRRELLAGAPQIHVLAQRRAFPVACYLAYALDQLELQRAPARRPRRHAAASSLRGIAHGDVLLVASFRNYTPEVVETALAGRSARRLGVAITDSALSPLKPRRRRLLRARRRLARPFRSLVAPLCLAQALVVSTGHRLAAPASGRSSRQRRGAGSAGAAMSDARRSTSSAWAAPRSTCTASRSAAGSRTCARFAKYLGGSPANTAVGVARLGLKPAMLTPRRRRAQRPLRARDARRRGRRRGHVTHRPEAADRAGLPRHPRPRHLPAGLLPRPLRRHGRSCADDVDAALHRRGARAAALRHAPVAAAARCAACRQRDARWRAPRGTRVVLDIDYRPVLWGLTAPGLGEQRYVASDRGQRASAGAIVADCDLVVGTEEEIHIAGGSARHAGRAAPPARADARRRSSSSAGRWAASSSTARSPTTSRTASTGPGFPVEVFNVLGAGDAFMAGFLRGWLRERAARPTAAPTPTPAARSSSRATAARRRCRAGPSSQHFLAHGSTERAAARRRRARAPAPRHHARRALAASWRCSPSTTASQLEELAAARTAPPPSASPRFKRAASPRARGAAPSARAGRGRRRDPRRPLRRGRRCPRSPAAAGGSPGRSSCPARGRWRSRPAPTSALALRAWPAEHVAKCLVCYHPRRSGRAARGAARARCGALQAPASRTGHELLVEVIPPRELPRDDRHAGARARADLRRRHPSRLVEAAAAGSDARLVVAIDAAIARHDPHCRGVLLLGLEASEDDAGARASPPPRRTPVCKGFAVGRSIFADARPRRGSPER